MYFIQHLKPYLNGKTSRVRDRMLAEKQKKTAPDGTVFFVIANCERSKA
jgi:hypothetical protein